MNKEVIAARIAENEAKLAELKESRKLLIAQNKICSRLMMNTNTIMLSQ